MHDDDKDGIEALIRQSRDLRAKPEASARVEVREAIAAATERRLVNERIRKRALKAMVLEKAGIWRRFLRRRLPLDA